MKIKSLYSYVSAVLLTASFASCSDEMQELAGEQSQALKQIVMTTQDFHPEAGSRTIYQVADGAVTCTWAENDTVGVFPDKGAQAYFPMASGAGTKNASFDGEGWALKDGRTYGAYYPCIGEFYLDRNAVPVSYIGQKQVGNGSMAHLGNYDYMVATPTAPEFGSAQFMFKHLSALVQLKITVPQPATFTSVKLVTDTEAFAVEGKVDVMAKAPVITPSAPATEVVLNLQDVATTQENEVVTFYFMLPPADLSGKTLKAVLASDKGDVEVELESKNFKAGTAYALSGTWEIESPTGDGSYKDGVVSLAEAGTMKELLGKDYLDITSLKVVGPINGDDVRCLRQMLGASSFNVRDRGILTTLDLSEATIVEGGEWYYESSPSYCYYTSNNVIGYCMFYRCYNLESIFLPVNITSIGYYAFYDCPYLKSVHITDLSAWCKITFSDLYSNPLCNVGKLYLNNQELAELVIPEGIKEIKNHAFYGCSSLTSINIHDGVTSIGERAFSSCSSLTSLDIPDSVTSIGSSAFSGCSSLTSIDIPDGVTSIGNSVFFGCSSLTSIDIPDSVTSIGEYAFSSCTSLAFIDIPNSVISVGKSAFRNCSSLTSIDIPDGVTSIAESTFSYCTSLAFVTIGNGVTSIGSYAFFSCKALKSLYCHTTIPPDLYYPYDPYDPFPSYDTKTTLHVPARCGTKYKSSYWGKYYFKTIKEME